LSVRYEVDTIISVTIKAHYQYHHQNMKLVDSWSIGVQERRKHWGQLRTKSRRG